MKTQIALSALSIDLNGRVPSEIQLTPDGLFRAKDGRPEKLNGWILNNENAQAVVQLANAQSDAFVIDFEHQTLYAKQNGMPAPAAGWFSGLEYREGLGLFATQVEWTDSAALAIQNKEYRYISPVISYDTKTGAVTKVHMAALTNNPALDGMKDLTALAQDLFLQQQTDSEMDKVKELEEQVARLSKQLEEKDTQLAALSEQKPDPTKYAPVDAMAALQSELTTIQAERMEEKTLKLVEVALSDGRLLPAQKEWAIETGKKDFAWLSARIEATPKNLALLNTQTGGTPPEGETPQLAPEELAVCSAMGLTAEQFLATKGA
jgi:phage I-like protein